MGIKLRWVTVPNWYKGFHIGYDGKPGLYRVLHRGEVVAIGQAASGLAQRLTALARRKRPENSGSEYLIYRHRAEITIQVAELELGDHAINDLRDQLIQQYRPRWITRVSVPRGLWRPFGPRR